MPRTRPPSPSQCGVSHTYVAEVRSEHVETLPDAGPQEQEAASDTPPADDPSATEASGAEGIVCKVHPGNRDDESRHHAYPQREVVGME
jgi:hypothetical protein